MPLYPNACNEIISNLNIIDAGGKAPMIVIGEFTDAQFIAINNVRSSLRLDPLGSKEILYIGRHHYKSRHIDDGYTIADMVDQVRSALAATAVVIAAERMTTIQNKTPRADAYGNQVCDMAVFECTARKPRAELFSLIPKGDWIKPSP
jgi:hypothetical protein